MKKIIGFLALVTMIAIPSVSISVVLESCDQDEQKHTGTINDTIDVSKITEDDLFLKSIIVGKENFNKIVTFIEKNGAVVIEQGVPCDHQYTFIDSKGNEHFMTTIKEDETGNHSAKGQVRRIKVFANKNLNKDGHKDGPQFEYIITEKSVVSTFLAPGTNTDDIKFGYEDFLAEVNKKIAI